MAKTSSTLGNALSGAGSGAAIGMAAGPMGAGIGAGIGALAGGGLTALFGDGSEDNEKAMKMREDLLRQIAAIPEPQLQKLTYERYKQAGVFTPEMEKAIEQGPSAYENIKVNPKYNQVQLSALEDLVNRGRTGLSLSDRAALADIQENQARQQQAAMQGILQNRQMRGVAGGGDELSAALQSAQASANEGARAQRQQAAQAQQAALAAMSQAGGMATNLRSQDFGEQEKMAQARDELNRFNTRARQDVQQRNVASGNQAQQYNLNTAQDVANKNTGVGNQEMYYNQVQLPQSQYENSLKKYGIQSGAVNNVAGQLQQQAAAQAAGTQQMIQGLGQAGVAAAGMYKNLPKTSTSSSEPFATTPIADNKKDSNGLDKYTYGR